MNNILKAIATIATSIAFVSGSIALADGLAGKDKVRTPLAAGAFTMIGAHSQPARAFFVSKKMHDRLKITVWIRRNLRAQSRTAGTDAIAMRWRVPFRFSAHTVNPQLRIDRLRLIKRGMGSEPVECQTLHTHDRAICLRDAQLRMDPQWVKLALLKA